MFLSSLNCSDAVLVSYALKLLKHPWLGTAIHGECKELRLKFLDSAGESRKSRGFWKWFCGAGSYNRGETQCGIKESYCIIVHQLQTSGIWSLARKKWIWRDCVPLLSILEQDVTQHHTAIFGDDLTFSSKQVSNKSSKPVCCYI